MLACSIKRERADQRFAVLVRMLLGHLLRALIADSNAASRADLWYTSQTSSTRMCVCWFATNRDVLARMRPHRSCAVSELNPAKLYVDQVNWDGRRRSTRVTNRRLRFVFRLQDAVWVSSTGSMKCTQPDEVRLGLGFRAQGLGFRV